MVVVKKRKKKLLFFTLLFQEAGVHDDDEDEDEDDVEGSSAALVVPRAFFEAGLTPPVRPRVDRAVLLLEEMTEPAALFPLPDVLRPLFGPRCARFGRGSAAIVRVATGGDDKLDEVDDDDDDDKDASRDVERTAVSPVLVDVVDSLSLVGSKSGSTLSERPRIP